ncbi:MAG: CCA tRNA nucleotidyltransferase [Theionarchaea archaeon]|nr:CCA tRNA nucleotidyltransferase [Theionarchaea archaeon]MBU7034050.1 CCA tRNA nucleotidyltransferase [Theionarchaea archaeon]
MKEVLEKIRPTEEERKAVKKVISACTGILKDRVKERELHAEVTLQGSMAKDTWISGDRNVDMFLIFSHDYSEKELKQYGLEIGVLGDHEIAYAEHPYVRNFVEGYEVDVVPAYTFREGIRSSVDRTPLHTEYVLTHLTDKDQVRLLKKFTRSIAVYGSDLKVQGLSGYLCELLVIKYGTFFQVLENMSTIKPRECLYLEMPPSREFTEPLVFVDPVDPERNVAAVVSLENLARLVHHAREFLKNPEPSQFFREPESYKRISGTELYRIDFQLDVIDDILFPQLRKTRDYMVKMLEHHGFRVFNTAVFDRGILIELSVFALPPSKKHLGPPVYEKEHCERFLQKHAMAGVDRDRIYAVIDRKYVRAGDLLRDLLKNRQGFGKDLISAQAAITLVSGNVSECVY